MVGDRALLYRRWYDRILPAHRPEHDATTSASCCSQRTSDLWRSSRRGRTTARKRRTSWAWTTNRRPLSQSSAPRCRCRFGTKLSQSRVPNLQQHMKKTFKETPTCNRMTHNRSAASVPSRTKLKVPASSTSAVFSPFFREFTCKLDWRQWTMENVVSEVDRGSHSPFHRDERCCQDLSLKKVDTREPHSNEGLVCVWSLVTNIGASALSPASVHLTTVLGFTSELFSFCASGWRKQINHQQHIVVVNYVDHQGCAT